MVLVVLMRARPLSTTHHHLRSLRPTPAPRPPLSHTHPSAHGPRAPRPSPGRLRRRSWYGCCLNKKLVVLVV